MFRTLFVSSRPLSWVNTAFPFAAAYVLTAGVDITLVIGAIYFLIPYNLAMYGINDVFDYESDLRNPRKLVSPFILEDASDIGQLRADLPFLERLGEELTRPVLPSGAAIDYIPSQYLCEFIKKCGFDGVVYRSSVSDGINFALFEPEKATGGAVALYNVAKVTVEVVPA